MVLSGPFGHCYCFATLFTAISTVRTFWAHWCYDTLLPLISIARLLVRYYDLWILRALTVFYLRYPDLVFILAGRLTGLYRGLLSAWNVMIFTSDLILFHAHHAQSTLLLSRFP